MLKKKSVKINSLLSIIKQFFTIIFPLITFPYATRVLGVENYGKYIFSASIVNYISYIAAAGILRYAIRECARVRNEKQKLYGLVNDIYTINLITTFIALIVLCLLLLLFPTIRLYSPYILVISISVIFTTLGTDWINSAFEEYSFITIRYVISQILSTAILFVLVNSSDDLFYYSFVSVSAIILANILNMIHVRKNLGIYPKFVLNKKITKHFRQIFYLFASTIATFIYINSDISILRIYCNDVIVSYYGVSTQFYQLVKQLINAAFIVLIPRISSDLAYKSDIAFTKLGKIFVITILTVIPASVGLFVMSEELILFVSGKEYIQASYSLSILSISIIPAMIANYYINIVMIPLKMEKKVMFATISSALVNIILNFVLIPIYSELAAALTTLIAEFIMVSIAIYYCRDIKIKIDNKVIIHSSLGSIFIYILCLLLKKLDLNIYLNIIFSIILSVLLYSIFIYSIYRKKIIELIK